MCSSVSLRCLWRLRAEEEERRVTTLKSTVMRTVDVARRAGYSVQQVRNLERAGVLPPAKRTASGYRTYGEVHLQSALAYRALAAGTGPVEAKRIVRAVHERPASEALALLDAVHARLDRERTDLASPRRRQRRSAPSRSGRSALGCDERLRTCRRTRRAPVDASALGRRRARCSRPDLPAGHATVLTRAHPGRPDRPPAAQRRIPHRPPPSLDAGTAAWARSEDLGAALAARDATIAARSRALLDAAVALSALLAAQKRD